MTKEERSELIMSKRKPELPCPRCKFPFPTLKLHGDHGELRLLYCHRCKFGLDNTYRTTMRSARSVWNASAKKYLSEMESAEDEYISRNEVECFITNGLNNPDKKKVYGYDAVEILTEVTYMDAADVRPIVKGEWVRQENGTWVCSRCKSWIPDEQHYYARFCLFCGADMQKENQR